MKVLFFLGGLCGVSLSLLWGLDTGSELFNQIFYQIRLPRLILSILCGGSLSIVGLYFQSLFRNDLASPYTLGVASGASFGASVALLLGLSSTLVLGPFIFDTVSIGAFIGSLLCVGLIISLSVMKKDQSPHFLILSGVMLSFMFSSGIMLVQFMAKEMGLMKMIYWLMGDLNFVGMNSLYLLFPFVSLSLIYAYTKRDVVNILSMGDRFALSKGIDAHKERKKIFITLSILVAYLVSLCGPIGFVGLVIPHIVKKRFGSNLKVSFIPSLFGGAFFLVWCDFLARNLFQDFDLPVGVLTSFIGGGFFLYLLLKRD